MSIYIVVILGCMDSPEWETRAKVSNLPTVILVIPAIVGVGSKSPEVAARSHRALEPLGSVYYIALTEVLLDTQGPIPTGTDDTRLRWHLHLATGCLPCVGDTTESWLAELRAYSQGTNGCHWVPPEFRRRR